MVQVVWRGQRRRVELDGASAWRSRRKAEMNAEGTSREAPAAVAGHRPAAENFQEKMLRYRATKLAEKEGLSFEEALEKTVAVASSQTPASRLQQPKAWKKREAKAAPRLAKKSGSGRKVQSKHPKRKSRSYPFFLFWRGGAPGLGKRK